MYSSSWFSLLENERLMGDGCSIIVKLDQVEPRHREDTVSQSENDSDHGQRIGSKRQGLQRAREDDLIRIGMNRNDLSLTRTSSFGELQVTVQLPMSQREGRVA